MLAQQSMSMIRFRKLIQQKEKRAWFWDIMGVLPQVSKRHGVNVLSHHIYTHSPITNTMNLYFSCPLHLLASCVNNPSKSQQQRQIQHGIKVANRGSSRCNVSQSTAHISLSPNTKTIKSHAHHATITTSPPPSRTPQPNLHPRPPPPTNRPLRFANNGKRNNNNNPASQSPHTRQLHRPPTHMSPNTRRDQLATLRTKRLYHPSYVRHAPRCLPGAANSCADRRHGGSAMEAGSRCHGGSCVLGGGMVGYDCEGD